jgi:hypothetical protein
VRVGVVDEFEMDVVDIGMNDGRLSVGY